LGIAKFLFLLTAFKYSISFDEKGVFEVMRGKKFFPAFFAAFPDSSRQHHDFSLQMFETSSFCHQK